MGFDYDRWDVENAFLGWLVEIGIPPDGDARLRLDGEKHRYRTPRDRRGKENIEYKIFMDERPAGYVKDYKTDEYRIWTFARSNETPWTQEEKKKYFEEQERRRAERKKTEERARALAIERAAKKWKCATEPDPQRPHPYIKAKGLSGTHGARVLGKDLVIPCFNSRGEVVNVQTIDPSRETPKLFEANAPKKGTFFVMPGDGREVFVCEGFATGATIQEATGRTVVVAWDRGNLLPVAERMRNVYPGRLILAPDSDRGTTGNPGMAAAFEILETFGVPFIMPEFGEKEKVSGKVPSDWNDYAALHDIERTAEEIFRQLEERRKQPEVEEFLAYPRWIDAKKNGDPKEIKENLEILLEFERLGIAYDEVTKRLDLTMPGKDVTDRFGRDNRENAFFAMMLSACRKHNFRTTLQELRMYLGAIAAERRYNSVHRWIREVPWDGADRIEAMCGTVREADWFPEDFKKILMRKWFISAAAASHSKEGFSARGVLVLQGRQGAGKTKWYSRLVPAAREQDWFISMSVDTQNKDDLMKVSSRWIVELGEIDSTFKKSDISRLKSFITMDQDVMRLPFASMLSDFPRRTVFCGTVNQIDFLTDTTGNSRWWVVPTAGVDYGHKIDIQQFWAQVWTLYRQGEIWWLTPEEDERL
ncbi:MAG: toprim domain-containing protein, partial [Synergistaceae bacterium]|nr:toprim domain-containing protein [Synergistaceae bacterium]